MVKIMENPIKMDDLGGENPLFSETSHIHQLPNVGHNAQGSDPMVACYDESHQEATGGSRKPPIRGLEEYVIPKTGFSSGGRNQVH